MHFSVVGFEEIPFLVKSILGLLNAANDFCIGSTIKSYFASKIGEGLHMQLLKTNKSQNIV